MSSKPGQTEEPFVIEKQAESSTIRLWGRLRVVGSEAAMRDLGGGRSSVYTFASAFLLPAFILILARSGWK